MMSMRLYFACTLSTLALALAACGGGGGGGGGGNANNPPPPGGGGGGGGGTVTTGGLLSGGVGVVVDTSTNGVSVTLDVAVGGTGLVAGDIQDFGSVIANDITTNTDNAQFFVEGVAATQAELKQGQQVLIVGDTQAATATRVLYRANVKGPVTAATVIDPLLGRATYTVLGQTVTTDATTTFADTNASAIALNDLLEVSGTVEENGEIVASFIEPKTSLAEYKVTGVATSVTATQFTLGGLTVDYASAMQRDFDAGGISEGDVVEARAAPGGFSPPAQLTASDVERLPLLTVGGSAEVRLEGFIDAFTSAADFEVQTTPVTTDGATAYFNGEADDLNLGVKVQIEGTSTGSGAVLAQTVTFQSTKAIRAEGKVEAIDGETVTVLGVTFTIRDLTEFEDDSSVGMEPFTLADLGVTDEVEIRGYLDGSTVVATSLEREDPHPQDRARLRGPVTAEDATAGTIDILNVTVRGEDGVTGFEDIDDNPISQARFHELLELGDFVTVRWEPFTSTTGTADTLSLEEDDD